MKIPDLKNTIEALSINFNPPERYLIFSRTHWESEPFKSNGYSFSKQELDAAEKLDSKLIGIRNGVKCYLLTFTDYNFTYFYGL